MKVFKLIFSISLSVIFVVSTLVAMFNAGSIVNAVLGTYILEVEEEWCDAKRVESPVLEVGEDPAPEIECGVDYNGAKRDIASGIAYLIVSTPLAYFTFRKSQSLFKGEGGK